MSVAGSSWIGKKIVDGFEHQRKKADGKTETVDLTEGLTDPQQAILGITKVIAITPSGIVFKKASALGIKIILDELPAYFDISMGLKSDLKAIDAADPTKPLKYPNLRNQAWVQRVLGPLPGLKSSVNFDSNLKTLDDELNGAEKKIKELKDDLSKDVSKLNYIDITERIEHIKEHLIKAAKELGLSMAIYDNTNPTINDRVRDFNQIFKEAFELNKKFIDIKQKNPNLVMKSLKVLANGVGIGYNGFFNPYGSGKIYTFALSNMIYFSPHLGFEPPSFNPSEAAKDYIWFNTYFQLGDSAARLAHTVGTYAWNRYWGKKDIFDFPSLDITALSSSDGDAIVESVNRLNNGKMALEFDAKKATIDKTIEDYEVDIRNLQTLKGNIKTAMKQLNKLFSKPLTEVQKDQLIGPDNYSINILLYNQIFKKDPKGETFIGFTNSAFNNGQYFDETHLTSEVLPLLKSEVETAIRYLKRAQLQSKGSVLKDDKERRALGIGPKDGVIPRRRAPTLLLKDTYDSYTETEKAKYFQKLSENVNIKQHRFINLDTETQQFLNTLKIKYKEYSKEILPIALIAQLHNYSNVEPTDVLMATFENEIAPSR